jgi:hypothetical protein
MVENPSLNGAFSTNSSRHNISLQENLSTEVGEFEILEVITFTNNFYVKTNFSPLF